MRSERLIEKLFDLHALPKDELSTARSSECYYDAIAVVGKKAGLINFELSSAVLARVIFFPIS